MEQPSLEARTNPDGSVLGEIPLVAQMLADPGVQLAPRAVDARWAHEGLMAPVTGFNPYRYELYYAARSSTAEWLRTPGADLRDLNEGDCLLKEVLFLAHDYLHAWSVDLIRELAPELAFGHGPITADTCEDQVFCHLLTEAVATVGLDYWFLACHDLEDLLGVGTNVQTLTTPYREADLVEYRRFHPGLVVQQPEFLATLTRFYCSGSFPGFGVADVRRSPKLLRWLRHELLYGTVQRRSLRQWLNYLSNAQTVDCGGALDRPMRVERRWQERLMREVSERLWEKVRGEDWQLLDADHDRPAPWAADADRALDFRFTNANALGDDLWDDIDRLGLVDGSIEPLLNQVLAGCRYAPEHVPSTADLKALRDSGSAKLLRGLVASVPRVEGCADEPRDLFMIP